MNLLVSITKLRIFKCRGHVSLLISKQSILLPSFCIILVSAAISSISVLNESQHLNSINSTLVKESPICMKVKMVFFHICGVLPTITVHVVILMSAFRYYKDTNMKFARQSNSTHGKRFRVLCQSFQLYLSVFICTWSPFVVLSWLRFNTNDSNLLIIYQHSVLCSKIALVLMSPIADGMLQCRNRKAISESILPFILEISNRIIKGRNSKSYLLTVEKSTEKNHQNFDDCGIQSITVMTEFITEHPSTQETNTMDEHEMQSLCYRRLKYNLPVIKMNSEPSYDASTTRINFQSSTQGEYSSIRLSPLCGMSSSTSRSCSPSHDLLPDPRSTSHSFRSDSSSKSFNISPSLDLSPAFHSCEYYACDRLSDPFDLSPDFRSSDYITCDRPSRSFRVQSLDPKSSQYLTPDANLQSTGNKIQLTPSNFLAANALQHFTFSPRCFSTVIKNRRCHSSFVYGGDILL